MTSEAIVLPGQETLFACWEALAQLSPGAALRRTAETVAAVFPGWAPLNNAVMLSAPDSAGAARAAAQLTPVYAQAELETWAPWVPSLATDFDQPDDVRQIVGLKRDTTTVAMVLALPQGLRRHEGVVRTSIASATRAGDEPVPAGDLEAPDTVSGLSAWVLVDDGLAVAGAWSFLHGRDCGVYAVGTVQQWRRRGLARALTEHVLAEARSEGARTASLQSTRMGHRLYELLGFEAAGRYEEWTGPVPTVW